MVPNIWELYNTCHLLVTSRTDCTNLCQSVALLRLGLRSQDVPLSAEKSTPAPQHSCWTQMSLSRKALVTSPLLISLSLW